MQAHIFDLDDTLLDHRHSQGTGLEALVLSPSLKDYAVPDLTDLKAVWLAEEDKHYARYERQEISNQEQRRERLRGTFPEACRRMIDKELDDLYDIYLKGYESGWKLYPDVLPALDSFAREQMALITNGPSEMQRKKIKYLELEKYFSHLVISSEINFWKPAREIFERAAELLGIETKDGRYVGDNFHNDVVGSTNAGMNAVWLNRHRKPKPDPDVECLEIHSLEDLHRTSSS